MTIPAWLRPIQDAATSISVHDLTRFQVPKDSDPRRSAVLMLFGEGPAGPDLLLTERAHDMASHPGQVSFPGGSLDPGETPRDAALREAWEEVGLDPAGVEVFAELPELWLPPSDHAVVPVLGWWRQPSAVSIVSPAEVHAIYRAPIAELRDPAHRIVVAGPSGWRSPGFLIGDRHDVILWGFTGGIVARLFEYVGWLDDLPNAPEREVPAYMLGGRPRANPDVVPNTKFPHTEHKERRGL